MILLSNITECVLLHQSLNIQLFLHVVYTWTVNLEITNFKIFILWTKDFFSFLKQIDEVTWLFYQLGADWKIWEFACCKMF